MYSHMLQSTGRRVNKLGRKYIMYRQILNILIYSKKRKEAIIAVAIFCRSQSLLVSIRAPGNFARL